MPLVYVGRKTLFQGRPLWEILLNLKNFGAGRIVTRHTFQRYPELTYFKIIKAQPRTMEYPEDFWGSVLVEKTFRGVTTDEPYDLGRTAYKPDYFLIPKHEEEAFIKSGAKPKEKTVIYPRYLKMPYLWQELVKRDMEAEGLEAKPGDMQVPVVYHQNASIRVAKEGQEPTITFDKFRPLHPELYANMNTKRSEDGKSVGIAGEHLLPKVLSSTTFASKYKKNLLIHLPTTSSSGSSSNPS